MSSPLENMQAELIVIYSQAEKIQKRLDNLNGIRPVNTAAQRMAIESAQNGLRSWRGINLGELLNEFGLPPEKRP